MSQKQPAGPVNLHKSLATGTPLKEAESKALGGDKGQTKPSKR